MGKPNNPILMKQSPENGQNSEVGVGLPSWPFPPGGAD